MLALKKQALLPLLILRQRVWTHFSIRRVISSVIHMFKVCTLKDTI